MKRKIVKQGAATMTISLPAKWCKSSSLKGGDEIELDEKNNNLIISTTKLNTLKQTKLDLTNLDERVVRWSLSSLHKSGFSEIELIYKDISILKVVRELIKDLLIGIAIIEQTDKRFVLKSITKDNSEEFDNILRRAFLVTLSMGDNSLQAIKNKEPTQLKELVTLEKTNNQLTNYCERLLNMKGYKNAKTNFIYVIIWNLEKVCDDYKLICDHILKNPTNLSDKTLKLYEKCNNILRTYYEIFYKFI